MTVLTCVGLYYKLHGAHRPVTMKKPIIKRRKRVIPASQDAAETEPADSPSPSAEASSERGSMNPDGSVNLGHRLRPEPSLTLVPEAVLRQNRNRPPSPIHSGNLTQYHSSPTSQPYHLPESLTNENRLAPLTSIAHAADRKSSLSPASFLSPSRKRSFSSTDMDSPEPADNDGSTRLSSIKSLLNHASTSTPTQDAMEQRLPPIGAHGATGSPGGLPPARHHSHDSSGEGDRSLAQRRLELERNAERMREMLAANERELASLESEPATYRGR